MTTRRNFLRLLAGALVAPKVSYFLPPISGWQTDYIVKPNCVIGLDYYPGGRYNEYAAIMDIHRYQMAIYEAIKLRFPKGVRLEGHVENRVFTYDDPAFLSGLPTANSKSYTADS